MKSFLIILVALILGAAGGYFAWKYFANESLSFGGSKVVTAENYKEPFMWGITMRPTALGRYIDENWVQQIELAKILGVKWARISWSFDAPDQNQYNDEVINYLRSKGLEVYLIFEPGAQLESIKDPYSHGWRAHDRVRCNSFPPVRCWHRMFRCPRRHAGRIHGRKADACNVP